MAKTKELRCFLALTVNLGNYESAKIEVGEIVELEEDDDPKRELARLLKRTESTVEEEAKKLKKQLSK